MDKELRVLKTKRYFTCDCGDNGRQFEVEHLFAPEYRDRGSWTWTCHTCGRRYAFSIVAEDMIEVEVTTDRLIARTAVVEYDIAGMVERGHRLFAEVEVLYDRKDSYEENFDLKQFMLEENSCPTNYPVEKYVLAKTEAMVPSRDVDLYYNSDLHGLWQLRQIKDKEKG